MLGLARTLKAIASHPMNRTGSRGLGRFLRWQIGSRLVPGAVLFDWMPGARLLIRRGDTALTANVYMGLFELQEMAFLLHFLRPGDVFFDAGANLGSYTILASGAAGAITYAVEPIPAIYSRLVGNVRLNEIADRVHCINAGLGAQSGTARFTVDRDATMNRVVTSADSQERAIEVTVTTLDDIAQQCPIAIKIDVEGYESAVIAGASRTLANPTLRAITMELCGSASRYGFDEGQIVQTLAGFGFSPHTYDPFTRTIALGRNPREHNVLFLRDVPFIAERVKSAPQFKVHGHRL